MLKEFKDFVMRGNVIDLAIGVIIGGAFGKIVSSLVSDVLLPPIGMFLGKVDFSNLFINMSAGSYASLADAQKAGAATLNYGLFINNIINFLIIALVIFIIIKQVNRFNKPVEKSAAVPTTKQCPFCYSSIPIKASRCPNCTSQLK
jgi:large conductance mechanosensitive channel